MQLFLLTFGLLVLVVAAMAVGVIVQRKAMASSCGGLGSVGIDKACDCDDPCDKRKNVWPKSKPGKRTKLSKRVFFYNGQKASLLARFFVALATPSVVAHLKTHNSSTV